MVIPAWAPAAAQIGTQLLGGLFGDDGPGFQTQLNDQATALRTLIPQQIHSEVKAKVEAGKEYGIHPLVLFGGGGGGYSPSFQFNNDSKRGVDFEALGQNVGRAVDAASTTGERAFTRTMQALQLERAQLENGLLASQISTINRSGQPPMPGAVYSVPGQAQAEVATSYGPVRIDNVRHSSPRHTYLHEGDGRVVPILNPDAGDNEILMAWDFLKHTGPAEFRNMMGRSIDRVRERAQRSNKSIFGRR